MKERNSIINKNMLELKLAAIYNDLVDIPKVPFKKINECDYLYGSIRVTITQDPKSGIHLNGKIQIFY